MSPRTTAGGPRLAELADGVWAYEQEDSGWCVNNAGVLASPDGVTLVDTVATRPRAEKMRDRVAALDRGPVRTIVNTHHHGDHFFGNAAFTPATVIGHDLAPEEMRAAGFGLTELWPRVDWGELSLELPTLTFPDRLTLHHGERQVDLLHVGPAHTTNDVVVWLPAERILFAGDVLLSGCTPFVLMGSVRGSLAAVERLRALSPVSVVCGHGPTVGPEVIDETERYLRWLLQVSQEAVSSGTAPLEAARSASPGTFADLKEPERLLPNIYRAILELTCPDLPWGVEIDVLGIFEEMIEFNGGVLPICRA